MNKCPCARAQNTLLCAHALLLLTSYMHMRKLHARYANYNSLNFLTQCNKHVSHANYDQSIAIVTFLITYGMCTAKCTVLYMQFPEMACPS